MPMVTGNDTRMAALTKEFERLAGDEEPEAEVAPAEAEPEPTEPQAEPEPEAAPEGETAEQKADRERDDKGRFAAGKEKGGKEKPDTTGKPKPGAKVETTAPKPGATTTTKPPEKAAATATEPARPAAPTTRAPQSWTPQAREEWAKVPPAAQQEILRLEGETRRVLSENAQVRKAYGEAQQFRSTIEEHLVRPYEGIFRAEGLDPYQGVASIVQTYAALHVAPQQQKDAILADLVTRYGTIEGMNAILQGQAPAQAAAAPAPMQRQAPQVDPRAIIREELQALAQQRESQQADGELSTFMHSGPGGTEPEFIQDVWQPMQLILDAADAQGRKLTFEQAYNMALKMDENLQSILAQRAAAAAVTAQPSASPAQRARVAAATVRSKPAGGGDPTPAATDRRAMLEKAAAERSR
jgi:hypothetical protein